MLQLCQSTNVTMRGSKCHNTFTHMKGLVPLFHICCVSYQGIAWVWVTLFEGSLFLVKLSLCLVYVLELAYGGKHIGGHLVLCHYSGNFSCFRCLLSWKFGFWWLELLVFGILAILLVGSVGFCHSADWCFGLAVLLVLEVGFLPHILPAMPLLVHLFVAELIQ